VVPPLAQVDDAAMGVASQHLFTGPRSARSGAIRTSARRSSARSRTDAAVGQVGG
jgi:hypothetical protein